MTNQENTDLEKSCLDFLQEIQGGKSLWKDSTSYSRDAKIRKPTSFYVNIGICRVTITCGHRDYRPQWVFHCYELGFESVVLEKNLTAKQASERAIERCKHKAALIFNGFKDFK